MAAIILSYTNIYAYYYPPHLQESSLFSNTYYYPPHLQESLFSNVYYNPPQYTRILKSAEGTRYRLHSGRFESLWKDRGEVFPLRYLFERGERSRRTLAGLTASRTLACLTASRTLACLTALRCEGRIWTLNWKFCTPELHLSSPFLNGSPWEIPALCHISAMHTIHTQNIHQNAQKHPK